MFAEFFSLIKTLVVTGALFFTGCLVLLSLPKSRLRSVGLECMKYGAAAVLGLLLVSPVDLVPLVPIDDVGYLIGGIMAVRSGLNDRRQRRLEESSPMSLAAREVRTDSVRISEGGHS